MVNSILDTKALEEYWKDWVKSDSSILVKDTFIVGMREYGKYARHLATISWASEEEQKKRLEYINNNTHNSLGVIILWKTKCWIRQPKFIAFFDKHKGTKIERIYTFCAYDLLDYGILHFVKRLGLKLSQYLSGE